MLTIRHFGHGYRRNDPPPQCKDMYPTLIHHDNVIHVVELHFEPGGEMWEHEADHPILFMAIAGTGKVRVSGEETEMHAGQAVLWPADTPHKAWAEASSFTAITIEYDSPNKS